MHDIQKPYNMSFTDYKARVEQVLGYLTSFPAPSLRNKDPLFDDIKKHNTPMKPNIIHEALYNSLPKTWRDELERRETINVREVSEPVFIDIMLKIEEEDNAFRAKSAESRNNNNNHGTSNSRGSKRSRDGNNANQKKRSHNENKKHKANKMCTKCKEAGRSHFAYTSHNDNEYGAKSTSGKKNPSNRDIQKQLMKLQKMVEKNHKRKKDDSDSYESMSST
jgi:hypothetical protein